MKEMPVAQKTEEGLDLALAAELQAALLPKSCPMDCSHQAAAARYRMCRTIGGDFYDFIRINDDQVALVIGDVVGHGVRASLLMAQIMGFLRTDPPKRSRPGQVVKELNRMLIDLGERTSSVMTCTVLYAVIDSPTGMAFFVNAGHPRPDLCDRVKCMTMHLGPRNMLLGVQEFEPEEACLTFTPGQRLVLHTDGVTDAANPPGEHFGEPRLHELINRHFDSPPDQCAEAVFQAVEDFRAGAPQNDDETIVVVDRL
jgi:sigma-B regulation protein RsbU (phosphoserine phosphatase)